MLLVVGIALSGLKAYNQVTIRDHRKDKTRWVPAPRSNPVPPPVNAPDRGAIPVNVLQFSIDQYRDTIRFQGTNWGPLTNNSLKVFFTNKLVFSNASLESQQNTEQKEMLFFTDTLVIDGQSTLDLRKNSTGLNGFIMISCRILKVIPGSQLAIYNKSQSGLYRKFYLFTEQVFLGDRRAVNETTTISGAFKTENQKIRPPTVRNRHPASVFHPFAASVGFLPTMQETNNDFFIFFSRWVAVSYLSIGDNLDRPKFDKMQDVRQFIRFIALNKYQQLDPPAQDRCRPLIQRINGKRAEIFKDGFQFLRDVQDGQKKVTLVGSVNENGITYYLPPSFTLINTSLINGRTIAGYRVFDESQPDLSTIDFDVMLTSDTRLKSRIQELYMGPDETMSNEFEEIQFNNISVEGPDIIPNQTRISTLSNNCFNIRLAVNNAHALLFNRLFSTISSDIFLVGKWSNQNGTLTGNIKVPLSFTKQFNPPLEIKNGAIVNNSSMPAVVEFYLHQKQVIEQSPALLIDSRASSTGIFNPDDKSISLPFDAVSFKMNPERPGDYFEQIDNSDKLTQELYIENLIAPTSMDSTGYLQHAEIIASYRIGQKTFHRTIRLSAANTNGSKYLLIIPKQNKDPVPISITGKAFYENAEYDIVEVKLNNAEARFHLKESNLKNKM